MREFTPPPPSTFPSGLLRLFQPRSCCLLWFFFVGARLPPRWLFLWLLYLHASSASNVRLTFKRHRQNKVLTVPLACTSSPSLPKTSFINIPLPICDAYITVMAAPDHSCVTASPDFTRLLHNKPPRLLHAPSAPWWLFWLFVTRCQRNVDSPSNKEAETLKCL